MLGAITHITPALLEDLGTTMARSDTEYWVVVEADSDDEMSTLIPATSGFLHTVASYDPAPSAHLSSLSSLCSISLPELLPVFSPAPL